MIQNQLQNIQKKGSFYVEKKSLIKTLHMGKNAKYEQTRLE